MATVVAGPSSVQNRWGWNDGMCAAGKPAGIPPKPEPMVATGKWKSMTAAVDPKRASIAPGTFGIRRTKSMMVSRDAPAKTVSGRLKVKAFWARVSTRVANSPGILSICSPKKSFTYVLAMS
jgi:hypothetical protein